MDLKLQSFQTDNSRNTLVPTFGPNNDLMLDHTKGLQTVTSFDELKQDVMKILMTELGMKYLDANYGTTIISRLGSKVNFQSLYEYVKRDVLIALQYLQTLNSTRTDPDEQIKSIDALNIVSNNPMSIEIQVTFTTVGGKSTNTTTVIGAAISSTQTVGG